MKLILRKPWHYKTNARKREMNKPVYKPTPIDDNEDDIEWAEAITAAPGETVHFVPPKSE